MSDGLTPDEVRLVLRDYFTDHPGIDEVRSIRDAATNGQGPGEGEFDRARWATVAEQLGLTGMGAPESLGGLGLGLTHLVAAVEECGSTLYPGPARSAALIAWALGNLPSVPLPDGVSETVDRFLTGAAIPGLSQHADAESEPEYEAGAVSGRARAVTHGRAAELVLCIARTASGPAFVLVSTPDDTARTGLDTVDISTPRADLVFDRAPAVLVTQPGDDAVSQRLLTAARTLLAAEQVGGAQGCLAKMVDYAQVRRQFGRSIGTYQAIQHRCARTAIDTAGARSIVTAAATHRGDDVEVSQLSLLARAEAADCFNAAADSLVQVSGGIGFTWEHDAHLFFRRARTTAAIGGTPAQHRDQAVLTGCVDLLTSATS